jgi:putative LysE/RhtB family amino acid efflux pump
VLTYFLIGAAIGALTGVPIGPVNVAVIDAAYRHTLRRAFAVGIGGALGDGIYAAFGIVGVGPYLDDHPAVLPVLYAISGVVLLVYGILTVRSKPISAAVADVGKAPQPSGEMWTGFWLGFILIVANPAAIVTWVVIVGSFMAGLSLIQGIGATLGVSAGSLAWFAFVAYLSNHGKRLLGNKAVWITRIVGVLLVGYALFSLGRAAYIWFW